MSDSSNSAPLRPLANKDKESKVEEAKKASRHLRGTLRDVLDSAEATHFEEDDKQIIKFHGIYQQDDRDARQANKALGLDKPWIFMIRVKVPAGVLSADQYLGMDQLADEVTHDRSLRITTRQNFQIHGVLKSDLRTAIRRTNEILLDTLCGCGDVERNIMASPAPFASPEYQQLRSTAKELSDALAPKSRAYHEVWLNGEKVDSSQQPPEDEPLYGEQYLPRKFKTSLALPEDNAVDARDQDVGLVGIVENGELRGYNVYVGGGSGMTHKKAETYVRLATPLGYIDAENAVETVRVIASMHRDYGDRTDRKHARLKYVVEEFGTEAFRAEFQRRASFELKPWAEMPPLKHQDWLGVHEQGDGRYFFGLHVANGRVIDGPRLRYKTAIRKIVEALRPSVTLTPNQNIIFGDLSEQDVKAIRKTLKSYGIPEAEDMTAVRRHAMACPALPTCGLALTESERVMEGILDELEPEFERLGLENEPLTIRMTGCPNGCARPYNAEIGLVGHKPGHCDVFLGGSLDGERLADHYATNVPRNELAATLRPLLEAWAEHRMPEEPFGDFYQRTWGTAESRERYILTGARDNPARDRIEPQLQQAVST